MLRIARNTSERLLLRRRRRLLHCRPRRADRLVPLQVMSMKLDIVLLLLGFRFQLLLLLLFRQFEQFGLELVHILRHFGRFLFLLLLATRQLVGRQLLVGHSLTRGPLISSCGRRCGVQLTWIGVLQNVEIAGTVAASATVGSRG